MQEYNIHAGAHVCVCVCPCAHKHTCITATTTICIHFRNATVNVKENHKMFKINATNQVLDQADDVTSVSANTEILLRKIEKR